MTWLAVDTVVGLGGSASLHGTDGAINQSAINNNASYIWLNSLVAQLKAVSLMGDGAQPKRVDKTIVETTSVSRISRRTPGRVRVWLRHRTVSRQLIGFDISPSTLSPLTPYHARLLLSLTSESCRDVLKQISSLTL